MRCTQMEPTQAEKIKGRRTRLILLWLTFVMIAAPVVIFIFKRP